MPDDPKRRRVPPCKCGRTIEGVKGMVETVGGRGEGWKCVCGWWTWLDPDEAERTRRREQDRRHGYDNGMTAYCLLEQAFCGCTATCECGWDDDPEQEDTT